MKKQGNKGNKIKLNEFHQIKRKKNVNNPKKKLRDLERLIKNVRMNLM